MVRYWNAILAALAIFACGVVTGGLVVSHIHKSNATPARAGIAEPDDLAPVPVPVPTKVAPTAEPQRISKGKAPIRQSIERIARTRVEFLERMSRNLNLSDEQRDRIAGIIRDRQDRVQQISDRIGPEIHGELRQANEEIRRLLNPEQRRRFERMHRMRMQQRRPFGPKGGGQFPRNQEPKPADNPL